MRFSYSGKYFRYDDVAVAPKPLQKPHPPIRIAATSPDTFPAIGALGHAAFIAARLGTLSDLAPQVRSYREAYKAAGHSGAGEIYLRVPVYVAETEQRARDEPEESIMHFFRYLGDRLSALFADVEPLTAERERARLSLDPAFADLLPADVQRCVCPRSACRRLPSRRRRRG